jgi:predicted negative regulator of RcsB-dependent stress response
MDAEQRHELKTNELANLLLKLKDWSDKYLNTVLTIVAAAALAWAGYRFWAWRQENALQAAWAEVSRANIRDLTAGDAPLDQLRRVAKDAPDATVAAIARIRLAAGLIQRADEAGGEVRLNEAASELRSVVSSGVADSLKAAALFKLGSVCEGQRDLKSAREAYQQIVSTPQFETLPFRGLAEDRLKTLDDLAVRVEFLPGAPPLPVPPAPASAPATAPTSAPVPELAPIPSPVADPNPADPQQGQLIKIEGPISQHPLLGEWDPSRPRSDTQPASRPVIPPRPRPSTQPTSKPAADSEVEPAPAKKKDEKTDKP